MRSGKTLILTVVFFSGMTMMATEMTASRLLAPYFGTSLTVWAILIALIMIYLSVGYYLGGKLADRMPSVSAFYRLTAWAAFLTGLIPFVARPILRFSAGGVSGYTYSLGILGGSLLGVLLIASVPVTLLGCVSPFAVRLRALSVSSTGSAAGNIYALSTVGSIVGTLFPVFVLIPTMGTVRAMFVFPLLLLSLALLGLFWVERGSAWRYSLLLVILLILIALFPAGIVRATDGLVHEVESSHNYIRVVKQDNTWALLLNEGNAIHSLYTPGEILTEGVWDYFLVAPYFNNDYGPSEMTSLCIIGLAGGTVAKQHSAVYGDIAIDGVEIDPEIIRMGQEYFAIDDASEPNLHIFAQDGRWYLDNTGRMYDMIAIDAYRQPYIPFHLTTREFFISVRDHLSERGVAAINCGRTATDYRLVNALASTMRSVFPSVYIIDEPNLGRALGNSLVVATKQPTSKANFRVNLDQVSNPILQQVAREIVESPREYYSSDVVLTDDWAPVEWLVDRMMWEHAWGG